MAALPNPTSLFSARNLEAQQTDRQTDELLANDTCSPARRQPLLLDNNGSLPRTHPRPPHMDGRVSWQRTQERVLIKLVLCECLMCDVSSAHKTFQWNRTALGVTARFDCVRASSAEKLRNFERQSVIFVVMISSRRTGTGLFCRRGDRWHKVTTGRFVTSAHFGPLSHCVKCNCVSPREPFGFFSFITADGFQASHMLSAVIHSHADFLTAKAQSPSRRDASQWRLPDFFFFFYFFILYLFLFFSYSARIFCCLFWTNASSTLGT